MMSSLLISLLNALSLSYKNSPYLQDIPTGAAFFSIGSMKNPIFFWRKSKHNVLFTYIPENTIMYSQTRRLILRQLCLKTCQGFPVKECKRVTTIVLPRFYNSVPHPSTKETYQNNTVSNTNAHTFRTHTCNELQVSDVDKDVVLCGWLQYQRINTFVILRDGYGQVQVVLPQDRNDLKGILSETPLETVLQIKGTVARRPEDQIKKNIPTGEIEVIASDVTILNKADVNIPFLIRNYHKAKEDLRLKHRYLDFRFPEMQHNLRFRSRFLMRVREFLINHRDFVEVETPTLFKRTPGGAREFVVPTHEKNEYYSLVQSPQQLKQLLMVGSMDRYFQVARCYRDESTRPDRQPEFTQLDIELSFTTRDNILSLIEQLLFHCLGIP
uniref:Aspartate--tRNA ligase, mitochondrial n=1 Tax=Cacopsylla melanoneura TaxID=428564 RepID=A0A8D8XRR9_9HEMI